LSPRAYQRKQQPEGGARERILAAARALLSSPGDPGRLTIYAVAREADVARMTVYYQFGSKAGLLEALFDWLAAHGLVARLMRAMESADSADALDGVIDAFARFWEGDRVLMRRIRGMAALDDDIAAALADRDARRRQAFGAILDRTPGTPTGPARDDVLDALTALASFTTYDLLAERRPRPAVVRILRHLARAALTLDDRARR
jgi:AcrR family transcriptional regulator